MNIAMKQEQNELTCSANHEKGRMKFHNSFSKKLIMAFAAMAFAATGAKAQNPIIQTKYTADPAPMVYNDTVFLYVDHDEDEDIGFFNMKNWLLFKSTDMVNWTDCGEIASLKTFKWGRQDNGAWAPQCIQRNGKFYIYNPIQLSGIGVAVANSPYGPFTDALGKALIHNSNDDIDPTAFIDDDGQAYLYWGNPGLYYVKLNENMTSYSGGIVEINQTVASFGGPKDGTAAEVASGKYKDLYEEAPWLMKRNGLYYLVYAAGGVPEHLSYSTSNSPTGPWTYRGAFLPTVKNSFTSHSGIIEFKGNNYIFYHNGALKGGGGFRRSVCVEQFSFNADGTIPTLTETTTGVTKAVANVNPYQRVEAETMAFENGIETNKDEKTGMYVDSISNGDYIKVRSVDFGTTGAAMMTAAVACSGKGANIEVHIDNLSGTTIASLPVNYTAGAWKKEKAAVKNCTGVHDLYLVFKGDAGNTTLFKFDYWQMTPKDNKHKLIGINVH